MILFLFPYKLRNSVSKDNSSGIVPIKRLLLKYLHED